MIRLLVRGKFLWIVFVISVFGLVDANGQEKPLISLDLHEVTFESFARAIESQTPYRFYFKGEWVDTLSITVTINKMALDKILDEILGESILQYSIDFNDVYITPGGAIITRLDSNFFNIDANAAESNVTNLSLALFNTDQKSDNPKEQIYVIGKKSATQGGSATVAGFVREVKTGEPVVGATLYTPNRTVGSATDATGYYLLTLPKGVHEIIVSSVGMKTTTHKIILNGSGRLDINLAEEITPLKEVVIQSERDLHISGVQTGVERIDTKSMKNIPLVLGEADIIKVIQTLPGVQSVGEGTSGINVRGGATNQNLILFNNAVIFNPAHMFGFFSAFNPDILRSLELYKSGITADYGGRISSVLDIKSREGNVRKFVGSGGISPITARLALEGPIIADKTSILVAARTTYSNWLLKLFDSDQLKNSSASFYDINGSITHKFDDKNDLHAFFYTSHDKFKLSSDTSYQYGDTNGSLSFKHIFNNRLYGTVSGSLSKYDYSISNNKDSLNAFDAEFSVSQATAQIEMNYFQKSGQASTIGAGINLYGVQPGVMKRASSASIIDESKLQEEKGREFFFYFSEQFELSPRLSVVAGIRYSLYQYLGPRTSYKYAAGLPREVSTISDTIHYASGPIATYQGPEPRLSMRYALDQKSSIKLSAFRARQYINQVTNTVAVTPVDAWKLSDQFLQPQIGDQVSAGYFTNLSHRRVEFSTEVYYKWMHNSIDFKNSANLNFNETIETDLINSRGRAYGLEILLKKPEGKLNGWISYTYSRSLLQTKNEYSTETINNGVFYPSNQDKPHVVNLIGNYKFNRRFNTSLTVTYSSGRPITLPIAQYEINGSPRFFYSERNGYRMPDYFRTDFSINFEGNHKIKKLAHSSWTIAVYNLTGRKNPYSIFFKSENGHIKGYKLYVFAYPIPTITYNFKF